MCNGQQRVYSSFRRWLHINHPIRPFGLVILAFACLNIALAEPAFEDVSEAAGFSGSESETWGASWGDINGDRYPDIFISNHRRRAVLYRNTTYGTFKDVSQEVDVSNTPGWTGGRADVDHHGATWVDIDNDGDDDLYLTVSSDDDFLLINDGGLLSDASAEWEVDRLRNGADRMAIFLDYTGDGLLDIAKIGRKEPFFYPRQDNGTFGYGSGSRIPLECPDASFGHLADVSSGAGLELLCGPRNGLYPQNVSNFNLGTITNVTAGFLQTDKVNDVAIADYNGDLRPDLFQVLTARPSGAARANSNYRVEAQLISAGGNVKDVYFTTGGMLSVQADLSDGEENSGDPQYIDIGATGYHPDSLTFILDPNDPRNHGIDTDSAGINIGYDNGTGTWRIRQAAGEIYRYAYIIVDSDQLITDLKFRGRTVADVPVRPRLLMNYADGFNDETESRGFDEILCTSAVAGDFDNDMDTDLFLTCTYGARNIANVLYENQGDGTFVAVANAGGAEGLRGTAVTNNAGTSEIAITADYDLDGFLDLFVTNGNNLRPIGLGGPKQLFRNRGNANNWLELDLRGITSNRDGIGAKILVTAGGLTQYREQNGGHHRWSQNHKRIHVGLGTNTTADISVEWPNGETDNYNGVSANRLYELTQGGAVQDVTPDIPGAQCGEPDYDRTTEQGLFIWQDCTGSNEWHLRATAGGSGSLLTYAGSITADSEFGAATPYSFEVPGDILNVESAPPEVSFLFKMQNTGEDGIDLSVPQNANACLDLTELPAGASVLLGAGRQPASTMLNLDTLENCDGACHP